MKTTKIVSITVVLLVVVGLAVYIGVRTPQPQTQQSSQQELRTTVYFPMGNDGKCYYDDAVRAYQSGSAAKDGACGFTWYSGSPLTLPPTTYERKQEPLATVYFSRGEDGKCYYDDAVRAYQSGSAAKDGACGFTWYSGSPLELPKRTEKMADAPTDVLFAIKGYSISNVDWIHFHPVTPTDDAYWMPMAAFEVSRKKPKQLQELDGTYVGYTKNGVQTSNLTVYVRTLAHERAWKQYLKSAVDAHNRAYAARYGPRDVIPPYSPRLASQASTRQ